MEQTLALMLAGVVAVPLLQLVKRLFKLSGVPMIWATFILSIVIAVLTLALLGKASLTELISDPFKLFGSGGIVMSLATVVYRTLKDKVSLS